MKGGKNRYRTPLDSQRSNFLELGLRFLAGGIGKLRRRFKGNLLVITRRGEKCTGHPVPQGSRLAPDMRLDDALISPSAVPDAE